MLSEIRQLSFLGISFAILQSLLLLLIVSKSDELQKVMLQLILNFLGKYTIDHDSALKFTLAYLHNILVLLRTQKVFTSSYFRHILLLTGS